jgi:hypothetical protein
MDGVGTACDHLRTHLSEYDSESSMLDEGVTGENYESRSAEKIPVTDRGSVRHDCHPWGSRKTSITEQFGRRFE